MSDIVLDPGGAERLGRPPLLILSSLERLLDEHGLGHGPLTARRIGQGSSNATFLLERGGERFVLRRPPRPPYPTSTHDVVREARLQVILARLGARVPRILLCHEQDDILGVPFTIAEFIAGEIVTSALPPLLASSISQRRAAIEAVVLTLADIHQINVSSPLLEPFIRGGSYLERQLRRFGSLWQDAATREIPAMFEVESWLWHNLPVPVQSSVVHGDFRLGNIMLSTDSPVRVEAVLDWEMGAIGDPRADVGYFVATYSHPASYRTPLELSPVTALEGFPDVEEILALYSRATGQELRDTAWFETLALWKGTVFCEAIHRRFLAGELAHDPLAARLGSGVPILAAAAARAASL